MRPLDAWRGRPSIDTISTPMEMAAYLRALHDGIADGSAQPLTDAESAAIHARQLALRRTHGGDGSSEVLD